MGIFAGRLHVQTPAPGKSGPKRRTGSLAGKRRFYRRSIIIEGIGDFAGPLLLPDLDKITKGLGCSPYKIEENSFKIHAPAATPPGGGSGSGIGRQAPHQVF